MGRRSTSRSRPGAFSDRRSLRHLPVARPDTDLPPDALTGFLPPEDGGGHGQGHFSYTVSPKANLTTGTQIRNVAIITFYANPSIATDQKDPHDASLGSDPAKQAFVTIDAGPPTSAVAALPAVENAVFLVKWSGTDEPGGSGIDCLRCVRFR